MLTENVFPYSLIEVNFAIVCACLPTMKPLLTRYFPNVLGPTDRRRVPNEHIGFAARRPPEVKQIEPQRVLEQAEY